MADVCRERVWERLGLSLGLRKASETADFVGKFVVAMNANSPALRTRPKFQSLRVAVAPPDRNVHDEPKVFDETRDRVIA